MRKVIEQQIYEKGYRSFQNLNVKVKDPFKRIELICLCSIHLVTDSLVTLVSDRYLTVAAKADHKFKELID